MLKLLLCCVVAVVAVHASGDFVVLQSPSSVEFHGKEEVEQSLLKEVFSAALGYTIKQRGTWSGISITNPFNLPEALVVIAIEGVDTLDVPKGKRFPLNINENEETTWQALRGRLEERANNNTLVRINLGDGVDALGQSALGELKPTPIDETSLRGLTMKNEEDKKFLEEVQLLHAIAKKAPSAIKSDSKSDVYWLVVSGLDLVFKAYGRNSTASKEAELLLNKALNGIKEAFTQSYDGQVLIVAFTNDASKVRRTRSFALERETRETKAEANKSKSVESTTEAKRVPNNTKFNDNKIMIKQDDREDEKKKIEGEEETTTKIDNTSESDSDMSTSTSYSDLHDDSGVSEKIDQEQTNSNTEITEEGDLNLAKPYKENYPVIFNIILWFGVVFVFSLLAICIAIADMDPGRDSIIYRMTSNRMKKDN